MSYCVVLSLYFADMLIKLYLYCIVKILLRPDGKIVKMAMFGIQKKRFIAAFLKALKHVLKRMGRKIRIIMLKMFVYLVYVMHKVYQKSVFSSVICYFKSNSNALVFITRRLIRYNLRQFILQFNPFLYEYSCKTLTAMNFSINKRLCWYI